MLAWMHLVLVPETSQPLDLPFLSQFVFFFKNGVDTCWHNSPFKCKLQNSKIYFVGVTLCTKHETY